MRKMLAATSSAQPMPIWMFRRGQPETTPAPTQEPVTAAAIISTRVVTSMATAVMKRNAWVMVGGVWPTFRVPGIFSSGTRRNILKTAVVGANEPMPRVSKKFVTKPMRSSKAEGVAEAVPSAFARARRAPRPSRARTDTPRRPGPRGTRRAVFIAAHASRAEAAD